MGKQVETLKNHTDFGANLVYLPQVIGEFVSVDDNAATLMCLEPVDASDQRRLAGARRSADNNPLSA